MTDPKTARQRFAEMIDFTIRERNFSAHYVAQRCKVSVQDVERWRAGVSVPGANEWEQLHRRVLRDFARFTSLWSEARAEAKRDRELATHAFGRAFGQ